VILRELARRAQEERAIKLASYILKSGAPGQATLLKWR
jgi:hypothetical protein